MPVETVALARALIGVLLVRETDAGVSAGRIVEVEAYLGNDPASHSYRGQTPRNASMFLGPFHAYVYKIYGTSFCVNVSSSEAGQGEAVLIRALEPVAGIELMRGRRGGPDRDLCRGPGRLCQALAIDARCDGVDLLAGPGLWLAAGEPPPGRVRKSRRIGITKAAHRNLRFYEAGSRFLSGPRHLSP